MSQRFKSRYHPDGQAPAWVLARATARASAALAVPVMIATLLAVFQRGISLTAIVLSVVAIVLGAVVWARITVAHQTAQIDVRDASARVRSVWDLLRGREQPWMPILDLRETREGGSVTIGYRQYELKASEWSDFHELLTTLQSARLHRAAPKRTE